MDRQLHGGDTYGHPSALDFSSNTSPLGLPESVQAALAGSVGDWDGYPDPLCRDLTAAIAAADGVPAAWVHCGNGAGRPHLPRGAGVKAPPRAHARAHLFGVRIRPRGGGVRDGLPSAAREGQLRADRHDPGQAEPRARPRDALQPQQPHRPARRRELLRRILKKCADCKITLVVDECFVPFLDEPEAHTLKGELAAHGNLILLRAFTKLYAMAGLRLGYLLCANPETIEAVCAASRRGTSRCPRRRRGSPPSRTGSTSPACGRSSRRSGNTSPGSCKSSACGCLGRGRTTSSSSATPAATSTRCSNSAASSSVRAAISGDWTSGFTARRSRRTRRTSGWSRRLRRF